MAAVESAESRGACPPNAGTQIATAELSRHNKS